MTTEEPARGWHEIRAGRIAWYKRQAADFGCLAHNFIIFKSASAAGLYARIAAHFGRLVNEYEEGLN